MISYSGTSRSELIEAHVLNFSCTAACVGSLYEDSVGLRLCLHLVGSSRDIIADLFNMAPLVLTFSHMTDLSASSTPRPSFMAHAECSKSMLRYPIFRLKIYVKATFI